MTNFYVFDVKASTQHGSAAAEIATSSPDSCSFVYHRSPVSVAISLCVPSGSVLLLKGFSGTVRLTMPARLSMV